MNWLLCSEGGGKELYALTAAHVFGHEPNEDRKQRCWQHAKALEPIPEKHGDQKSARARSTGDARDNQIRVTKNCLPIWRAATIISMPRPPIAILIVALYVKQCRLNNA